MNTSPPFWFRVISSILCSFPLCSPAFDIISSSVSPLTTTQQYRQIRYFQAIFQRDKEPWSIRLIMTCSDSRDRSIIISIFGLIYGFSFGGQFVRAATWLIESAGKQSTEAIGEAGLYRRCIRAYGMGLIRTTSLLCEAPSHKVQIFCCQQLLPSIPSILWPCIYSRHLHYHITHCGSSAR